MIVFFVPVGATIWMYIRILANLKQGARNLEQQGIQGPAQQLHQAHKKVNSTLVIVTTAFLILVFPGAIVFIYVFIVRPYMIHNMTSGSNLFNLVDTYCVFLSLVNSVINPVLYGFKYEQLRKAFMSMVCRCDRWRQPNQIGPEIQTVEA